MKILKQLMSAVVLSIVASAAVAQTTETSPNLITNTWNNVTTGSHPNDCCTGGPNPLYDPNTNTIHFSYGNTAVHQVQAINQALTGSGIQINGWNWGYDLRNMDGVAGNQNRTTDAINVTSFITNSLGIVQQSDQYYNTQFDWTRFSGTETLNSAIPLGNNVNLGIQFVARDNGGWAGYYGPQVRNVSLTANYTVDQCSVNPQSSPSCPNYRTYYTFGDDSYAHVPLPFTFPFYGRTFTNSWMHSNGVVSFLDPMSPIEGGHNPGAWAYCCGGPDLSQNTVGYGAQFNYTIAPFWTDLYPGPDSQFYTTQDSSYIRYHWDNIADISNGANLNTFSLELRPSGFIGANYASTNSQQQVTIGTIGDLRLGEKTHQFFGIPGVNNIANWSLNATQATDCSNPLNNPYCPGYAEAYLSQQCTINALYNPSCPGYAAAYFTQQCTANPLYNPSCPGYATAYYDYQCSVNPLYHTGCLGYDTAYFNQQCGLNPLYDIACPGYDDAFYVQQCTISPLYDSGCTGYAEAYFSQQCSLDGLYNTQCPNYAEAYAKKNILNIGSATSPSTITTTTPVTVVTTTSDPVVSAAPVVADPIVNQAVTSTATSASPAQAATATVPLVQAPAATTTTTAVAAASTETKKEETKTADNSSSEEKKEETKTADSNSNSSSTTASSGTTSKDQPKTTRQALAERRLEAARAKAVEDGKQLAGKMGEAASLEAQVQVQAVVVAAMSFVPGFDRYSQATLPDVIGYKPFEIYRGQRNIDNPAGRRFLTGADARHQEMVDQQYAR